MKEEKMNKVVANFNMAFNEGSFKKGNIYIYKYKDEDNNIISVQTEQGTDIDFTFGEFHTLFSFLTI